VVDKVPIDISSAEAGRIMARALTIGEEEFKQANAFLGEGRTGQAILAFERLRREYPATWIDRRARERLATLQPAVPSQVQEPSAPEPAALADRAPLSVLVAYYSLTGNTEKMAQGVAEGVQRIPGVAVTLKKAEEISKADLEDAAGIVLGCPTYYGSVPGRMKTVIDDWSWKMKVDFTDKVGGAFSTGGGQVGGKEFVVMSLLMFMINNRMVVAGPLYQNDKTGSVWAEAGAAAMTGPLDPGVGDSELDSARRLGERVAGLTKQLSKNGPPPRDRK
jgi:NAD(P)H dehydrogenase (quinone)